MEVNILKSGPWAFKGIKVIDIKKGLQDVNPKELAEELVQYGWAELPGELFEKIDELTKDVDINTPAVESVEKKKVGWWYVKFEGRDEIVKVRGADNDEEAIVLANAELEVQ